MYKLSIALRYLLRRKIAYVSIVAIAFGVLAMVVVNSVMDGFQRKIKKSIHAVDGSITVQMVHWRTSPDHYAMVLAELDDLLAENGGPIVATSKRVQVRAMIVANAPKRHLVPPDSERHEFIQLIGVDPDLERNVLPFDEMLDAVENVHWQARNPDTGELERRGIRSILRMDERPEARARPFDFYTEPGELRVPEPGIVLGDVLGERLHIDVGDLVTVITARAPSGKVSDAERREERFVVTGCFHSGRYEYDSQLAFCDGAYLQEELGLPNDCDEVRLRLADPDDAQEVKRKITSRYEDDRWNPRRLDVWTWEDQMSSLASALAFEKVAMLVVLACIIAVAGACICGILYMVVLEKTRDIGILLSMGATSPGIVAIFLIYGGLLGFIGTLLGLFLGLQATWNLNEIILFIEDVFGIELFPPSVYEFDGLPTFCDYSEITMFGVATFLWCILASILPALRAARLDPLKCLVYE